LIPCLGMTAAQRSTIPLRPNGFSEDTGSDAALAWAVDQLNACKETHEACRVAVTSVLPNRVLALGELVPGDPSGLEADVHLHESMEGEQCQYVCLSHCWGGRLPIMLSTENRAQFRDNIPWYTLPKSYQDAIIFTRKLRIPYIWIDSLCILQDDREDWRQQSAQMASIYQNSAITLAASAARHGGLGCFRKPVATTVGYLTDGDHTRWLKDWLLDEKLVENAEISESPTIFVKERPWHPTLSNHSEEDTELIPLFSRGWAYQERILCPRVLHFGPQELFWECNERVSCECTFLNSTASSRRRASHSPKMVHVRAQKNASEAALSSRWRSVVSEYTSGQLTYASDKLPAIAGIAKQLMSRMPPQKYLAGLWERSLVHDLIWRVDSPCALAGELSTPSWSWASVLGPVSYPAIEDSDSDAVSAAVTVDIVDADCSSATSDTLVNCTSGFIVLRGGLVPTRLQNYVTRDSYATSDKEKNNFGVSVLGGGRFNNFTLDVLPISYDDWTSKAPSWPQAPPGWNTSADPFDRYATESNDIEALEYRFSELRAFQDHFIRCLERERDVWCLELGVWEGRTCFLVLNCVDEPSQTFRRLGIGWYSSLQQSLFGSSGERRMIRLI
jgi:hypothetical protein